MCDNVQYATLNMFSTVRVTHLEEAQPAGACPSSTVWAGQGWPDASLLLVAAHRLPVILPSLRKEHEEHGKASLGSSDLPPPPSPGQPAAAKCASRAGPRY